MVLLIKAKFLIKLYCISTNNIGVFLKKYFGSNLNSKKLNYRIDLWKGDIIRLIIDIKAHNPILPETFKSKVTFFYNKGLLKNAVDKNGENKFDCKWFFN